MSQQDIMVQMGLEAINQQWNHPFPKALEAAIRKLRQHDRVSPSLLSSVRLRNIIKKYTNLEVSVTLSKEDFIGVIPPNLNSNNVILSNYNSALLHTDADKILNLKSAIKGAVDLNEGKVYGDFSRVSSQLQISENYLWKASLYTVQETVAFILHEVGHVITYLELLHRSTRTNYIMQEIVERLVKTDSPDKRLTLLKYVEDTFEVPIENKKAFSREVISKEGYRVIFLEMAIQESKHQLGSNIYDSRSFEQLSDVYATRMGYGKHLSTGLNKVFKDHGYVEYMSKTSMFIWSVVIFIFLLAVPGMFIAYMLLNINPERVTHDPPKKRLIKIRHQLTMSLKNPNLSRDRKQMVLNDIDALNKITKDMVIHDDNWNFFFSIIPGLGRKDRKEIRFQEELEALANNGLFELAAKLD